MKRIMIAIGILTVVAGIIWMGGAWNTMRVNARTADLSKNIKDLFVALQKYKEQVGSYPLGGNTEVVKSLQGNNPKKVFIILGSNIPINDKNELVDPWGTPLRFYFSDTGILVRSAGPNRRFDDSTVMEADDYIRSN
jgi:type II secretory pathway pseudopilin PulG